jgi:hypothetical protein
MSDKYIARSAEIAARELGGEMIVMSAADSSLYTLNEQATAIWQAADGVTPLAELAERVLCAKFEVDAETAYRDALTFVEELAAHGILRVSDEPIE